MHYLHVTFRAILTVGVDIGDSSSANEITPLSEIHLWTLMNALLPVQYNHVIFMHVRLPVKFTATTNVSK